MTLCYGRVLRHGSAHTMPRLLSFVKPLRYTRPHEHSPAHLDRDPDSLRSRGRLPSDHGRATPPGPTRACTPPHRAACRNPGHQQRRGQTGAQKGPLHRQHHIPRGRTDRGISRRGPPVTKRRLRDYVAEGSSPASAAVDWSKTRAVSGMAGGQPGPSRRKLQG